MMTAPIQIYPKTMLLNIVIVLIRKNPLKKLIFQANTQITLEWFIN